MMATTSTMKRDLARFDAKIAAGRREGKWEARHGDDEMADAYAADADDVHAVRDAAAAGNLAEAGRLASDLDTILRDEIPAHLWNTLMRAINAR
jgi:hypothetical protein